MNAPIDAFRFASAALRCAPPPTLSSLFYEDQFPTLQGAIPMHEDDDEPLELADFESRDADTLPPAERDTLPPSASEEQQAKANSTMIPPGTPIEQAVHAIAKASREMRGIRADINAGFRSQGAQLGAIQRELRRVNQRVTDLEADRSEIREELLVIGRRLRRALERIEALEALKEHHAAPASATPPGS